MVPNGVCSVVGYRGATFQCGSNLCALFNAQRSELKSILSSQRPNNLRGDCLLPGVRQTDFENNGLSKGQGVSNEGVQPALAEITCPPF